MNKSSISEVYKENNKGPSTWGTPRSIEATIRSSTFDMNGKLEIGL